MQIIEIIVAPDGGTRVKTKGFAGSTCRAASAFIEQALGQPSSEQLTPDFYTEQTQSQTLQEGQ